MVRAGLGGLDWVDGDGGGGLGKVCDGRGVDGAGFRQNP